MKKVILMFSVLFLFSCNKETIKTNVGNNEKLCKTWQVVSIGNNTIEYEYIIKFNSEGTYVVRIVASEKEEMYHGTWSWCNSVESKFSFSVEGNIDCESNNILTDVEISSESFSGISFETGMPELIEMKLVK